MTMFSSLAGFSRRSRFARSIGFLAATLLALPLAFAPTAARSATAPQHARPAAPLTQRAQPGRVRAHATCPSARTVLAAMSLPQRVGELLMVGNPATSVASVTGSQIRRYHVGSVILTGRSTAGVTHTRAVVHGLQSFTGAAATGGTRLVIATDQEGGYVQVLQGSGFSAMPTALYQGTHWSLSTIRASAATWGGQLHRAGVDLDLAPVMDTVSESFAPHNAPIGYFYREYGYTPYDVMMRGTAFANGLRDARIGVTIKHFPGLGRVRRNTDTSSGVTDTVTTRHSGSIQPFAEGVRSGADAVMVSTAYYSRIAPNLAAFSTTIMRTMLRGDLGFTGVIISDDLGGAVQVRAWTPGKRAVLFLAHHGNLVLTVDPNVLPAMYHAILSRAQQVSAFRADVDSSALHVLRMKARLGRLC